jgi:hypothetical protein
MRRGQPQHHAAWVDSCAGARLTPAVGKPRCSRIARTPPPPFTYANSERGIPGRGQQGAEEGEGATSGPGGVAEEKVRVGRLHLCLPWRQAPGVGVPDGTQHSPPGTRQQPSSTSRFQPSPSTGPPSRLYAQRPTLADPRSTRPAISPAGKHGDPPDVSGPTPSKDGALANGLTAPTSGCSLSAFACSWSSHPGRLPSHPPRGSGWDTSADSCHTASGTSTSAHDRRRT